MEILARDAGWRGYEFFIITTQGGHDPTQVAERWTAQDVHDCYWDLALKGVLG